MLVDREYMKRDPAEKEEEQKKNIRYVSKAMNYNFFKGAKLVKIISIYPDMSKFNCLIYVAPWDFMTFIDTDNPVFYTDFSLLTKWNDTWIACTFPEFYKFMDKITVEDAAKNLENTLI